MKKMPTLFEREFENHKVVGVKNVVTTSLVIKTGPKGSNAAGSLIGESSFAVRHSILEAQREDTVKHLITGGQFCRQRM